MKIEIDIDIESIVKEALKRKELPIGNLFIQDSDTSETSTPSRSKWEYGRKNGRRRSLEEMALHDLEKEKGRRLTPEEKGQAKARVEIDETIETNAKEDALKKARIEDLTAEGLKAAEKELEAERLDKAPESGPKIEEEPEIPQPDPLENIDSLFK